MGEAKGFLQLSISLRAVELNAMADWEIELASDSYFRLRDNTDHGR
jgi:hypothetical protein